MKQIIIPALGESISEATIAKWYKKPGESVKIDEVLLEVETEKVTMEVCAPCSGIVELILKQENEIVGVGEIVGNIKEGAFADSAPKAPEPSASAASSYAIQDQQLAPSVRKIVAENNLQPNGIAGSGKDGRITKGDALNALESKPAVIQPVSIPAVSTSSAQVERVRMSRLRKTIAQRLKDSQNTAAILTTFNEVDMSKVMELRKKYKDEFEKRHQTKLGFMSFFVKAVVKSLQEIPAVNAEIDGDDIVYKNYYDIGVAVGTDQGLVVPVLRGAENLSFAEIEIEIAKLGKKAKEGKLTMAELTGGTFSISNGGTYGSLLSTPIINPPQSGILGMHKIQERAMVVNGKIEILPMMYLALSYDHRLIDGKEAVTFLVKVKEAIEDPERLLFDL
jgi:2-oxoglutarate dehydrogenase E2 component (dihydrolipoamide succinyltransferase)